MSDIKINEYYGKDLRRTYYQKGESFYINYNKRSRMTWAAVSYLFMDVFLPHGYPESVSEDYIQYQLWDSIQAFASSITVSLSTHAILKGAGVGDANASTLAAATAWIMKDGTSMVGRIMFTWLRGTKLDSDCKKWRLFADALNDFALFLDLISAYFPEYYVMILCASGIFKSVVGVAGGATRAAITQHQARRNNMADVSAKDGSQETLVNLAALICSLILLPVVTEKPVLVWSLYIVMTIVHLFSNYLAVKSVFMESFNTARFLLYMERYSSPKKDVHSSVKFINEAESVFLLPKTIPITIQMGVPFKDMLVRKTSKHIQDLQTIFESSYYMLTHVKLSSAHVIINICFRQGATIETQLEAMYHACLLRNMYLDPKNSLWTFIPEYETHRFMSLETLTRNVTQEHFSSFLEKVKGKGWRTDAAAFDVGSWLISL